MVDWFTLVSSGAVGLFWNHQRAEHGGDGGAHGIFSQHCSSPIVKNLPPKCNVASFSKRNISNTLVK